MYAIHSFCLSMWLLENLSELFSPTSTSGRRGLHSTAILGDDLLGQQDAAVHPLLLAGQGAPAATPSSA